MWSKISNYCKNFLPIHFLNIAFIFIHNLWWVLCSDIRIFAWTVPTNKLYPLAPLQRLCPDLKPNLEGSYSKQKLTTILKLGVMKVFIRQLQSYFIIANFWVNESECENSFVFATVSIYNLYTLQPPSLFRLAHPTPKPSPLPQDTETPGLAAAGDPLTATSRPAREHCREGGRARHWEDLGLSPTRYGQYKSFY